MCQENRTRRGHAVTTFIDNAGYDPLHAVVVVAGSTAAPVADDTAADRTDPVAVFDQDHILLHRHNDRLAGRPRRTGCAAPAAGDRQHNNAPDLRRIAVAATRRKSFDAVPKVEQTDSYDRKPKVRRLLLLHTRHHPLNPPHADHTALDRNCRIRVVDKAFPRRWDRRGRRVSRQKVDDPMRRRSARRI